jgi:hypothetical protein
MTRPYFMPALDKLKGAIVVTTINDGKFLQEYFDNLERFGHLDQCHLYVIADRKTPTELFDRAKVLSKKGLQITVPPLVDQDAILSKFGFDPSLVLWNSDHRRNIGYLQALADHPDFVVSIDDDNYPIADVDFFGGHAKSLTDNQPGQIVSSSTGFYNICSLLEFDIQAPPPYPRGYPYAARHQSDKIEMKQGICDVHLNAGLWLLDPDVDAISWLVLPRRVCSMKGNSLVLERATWTPINSQNTALRREAVAAYYFIRMRYPLGGLDIDRYGDIFQGYFVQACAKHLGGLVRVGTPLAEHRRNSHNYMHDAWGEWACIQALEDLLPWLIEVRLSGNNYPETFTSLSHALEEKVETMTGKFWTDAVKAYFHQMAYQMRTWATVCARIDA